MISFSVFKVHNYNNLYEFQQTLIDNTRLTHTTREWIGENLNAYISNVDTFDIHRIEEITVENNQLRYLFFEGLTERPRGRDTWYDENQQLRSREERIYPIQANILLLEHQQEIFCLVFKGSTNAKRLVRDIFPQETWGIIDDVNVGLTEDLFYWIFKRHIDLHGESLSRYHQIYVTALESFMGKTRDNVNAMRGEGNRISTILGTLAFLFNNENLKAVRPQIYYNNNSTLLEVNLTGTYKVWEGACNGRLYNIFAGERKNIAVVINIFVTLLPLLINCYRESVRNNEWSPQLKLDFIKRLGQQIKDRVEEELQRIEEEEVERTADDELEDEIIEEDLTGNDELEIDNPEDD
jgi:hypothetical protein